MTPPELVADLLAVFGWIAFAYFLALNTTYLVLILTATADLTRYLRRQPFAGYREIFASPLTLPVTIVVPAHNEEVGIVESVRAMLALEYPQFEVVVIDDGSTDRTFEVLRASFDLVEVPRVVPAVVPTMGRVLSCHVPRNGEPVLVVRKEGVGMKTDALNVGVCAARYPLLCMVDADALLDSDALLRVVKPFVDDPDRVVASGGVIRPANGCTVYRGRVTETRMPASWLARIQVVEYLRAFLLGRSGWSRLGSLLIISGAFGVFRRDLVIAVGGYDHRSIGEDAELVARLHRTLRRRHQDYRIVFIAEPVCWTEVPETLRDLGRQRRRWSRGLAELLRTHRRMVANPRYGRIGLVVLPYFVLFESLGPVIELLGLLWIVIGLVLHLVHPAFAALFLLAAIGYALFLSVASLVIDDFTFHRYHRARDFAVGLLAAVLENVGYRQLHAWWRLRGLLDAVGGRHAAWGRMRRRGFDVDETAELGPAAPLPLLADAMTAGATESDRRRSGPRDDAGAEAVIGPGANDAYVWDDSRGRVAPRHDHRPA